MEHESSNESFINVSGFFPRDDGTKRHLHSTLVMLFVDTVVKGAIIGPKTQNQFWRLSK